jgi:hypothetical protein
MSTVTSPTQLVTIERCNRRWWFEKVRRLDKGSTFQQDFGTALHALLAAHLLGASPEEDWSKTLVRDEITRADILLHKAIDAGWLERRPGQLVEHWFEITIAERVVNGRIDLIQPPDHRPGSVEDHKTTAAKKWAKKGEDLRADIPMMSYAGFFFQAFPEAQTCFLRHNQFVMDDLSLDRAECEVTRDECRRFWLERIIPNITAMENVRCIEKWEDVPGHPAGSAPCKFHSGCPFQTICHRGVPIEKYGQQVTPAGGAPF